MMQRLFFVPGDQRNNGADVTGHGVNAFGMMGQNIKEFAELASIIVCTGLISEFLANEIRKAGADIIHIEIEMATPLQRVRFVARLQ